MDTNVLVGFDFRITHSNGIKVATESLLQQLTKTEKLFGISKAI